MNGILKPLLIVAVGSFTLRASAAPTPMTNAASVRPVSDIPYVATRPDTVKDMLWMAGAGTNDVVYDLGSGDGRVVISAMRDFNVRKAVGIEIDPKLVAESRSNAAQARLSDRVSFIEGDLFTNDFSEATVLALYLGLEPNVELRSRIFRSLKPGARVISHQFGMGEWPPDKRLEVRTPLLGMYSEMYNPFATNSEVPEFRTPFARLTHDELFQWMVPAPVAGLWRGRIHTDSGDEEIKLLLHQRLSKVDGAFQTSWPTNLEGVVQADLWGSHLRLLFRATNSAHRYSFAAMWFEGHATGDTLQGRLVTSDTNGTRGFDWTARRDKADFTGTWEWPGPMNTPVQLKIQRVDGQLVATYIDPNHATNAWNPRSPPIEVQDFYDFGGGFYFTLLLGREPVRGGQAYSNVARIHHQTLVRRQGPEDGWVIGEAIARDGALDGTIAFYPYPEDRFSPGRTEARPPDSKSAVRAGRAEWSPKQVRQ